MKRNYFFITSIFMLILSLIAFSDNLLFDVKQKSNSDPKYIIHGLFCFAWFILLTVQSGYIRNLNHKVHIRLGIAGMLVAAGVFISTIYVFIAIYKGWDEMPFYVKANRLFMFSYALLIPLAYVNRKNGIKHKRYIFIATLFMLGPILDRVAGHSGIENVDVFNAIIWHGLFISLFIYDWLTIKKIHMISWMGLVWFYIVWTISIFS